MFRVLFYRRYRAFSGGHLKVWDYFTHVRESARHVPQIFFSDDAVWDETNPWREAGEYRQSAWRPEEAEILFLAGTDWAALDETRRTAAPVPIINLLQHVRHAEPGDRRYRFLERRAIRICVSAEVAAAVRATGRANGPVVVIPNGVDSELFGAAEITRTQDIDLLIAGLKQPELAGRLAERLGPTAPRVEVLTTKLPRREFLDYLGRSVVTVFLPNVTEGFYLPAVEGMGLGTVVVCPDCVGNRSFCLPGKNAFRPAYEEAAIVRAVAAALGQGAVERRDMLSAARATALEHSLASERAAFWEVLDKVGEMWGAKGEKAA